MTVEIDPIDLILPADADMDRVADLISTVIARAARFAPCIVTDATVAVAAKGILVDVINRRWATRNLVPGVTESKTLGGRSLSVDNKGIPTVAFYPTDVSELQALCLDAAAAATTPVYSFPAAQPWPDGICS